MKIPSPLPPDMEDAVRLSTYVGRYCIPTSVGHLEEEDYRLHHLPVLEYDCLGSDKPTQGELELLADVEVWRRLLLAVWPEEAGARANTHYICILSFRTLASRGDCRGARP